MPRFRSMLASAAALCFLVLPSAAGPPPSTNQLFGFISSNRTLTYAYPGPIYDVLGDLVVQPGVTLTIEPGVMLRVSARDTLAGGDYPAKSELTVLGTLLADGTAGDSIRIVSAASGKSDWGQIAVQSGGSATLKKFVLRGATIGCRVFAGGSITLFSGSIASGDRGVLSGGGTTISEVIVSDCDYGIDGSGAIGSMRACRLTGNGPLISGIGFVPGPGFSTAPFDSTAPVPSEISNYSQGVVMQPNAVVSNLVIRDNVTGIGFVNGGFQTVRYCTVVRSTGHGISLPSTGSVLNSISALNQGCASVNGYVAYSDLWSNTQLCGLNVGPNVASFNPFFVNAPANDFHLNAATIFGEWSNSAGQIGAYGPGAGAPVNVTNSSWGRVKALYR